MRLPLMLFLLAALAPVFFGKVRAAPLWLVLQALALAWIGAIHHAEWSLHTLIGVLEVVLVRGVLAPWLLLRAIRLRAEPDADLMPSNLFTWAIGTALIVLAFDFGGAAMADAPALALGVVGAMVAMVLLILSTNGSPAAQLVAVLFMFLKQGLDMLLQGSVSGVGIGGSVAVVSTVAVVAIYFLELFVAFLQAFVFMFLTSVFISQLAHHDEHGHHEGHDHEHAHAHAH